VTWEIATTGVSVDLLNVAYRLVENNGSMGSSGTVSVGYHAYQSDNTYNVATDEYLVVWREDEWVTTPSGHWEYEIKAARITGAGARIGLEFSITGTTSNEQRHPSVATDTQSMYFVVWEVKVVLPPVEWDVHGMLLPSVDPDHGTPGGFSIASSSEDEINPEVVATSMDGSFSVLYQEPRSSMDPNQRLARSDYSAGWTGSGFISLSFPAAPLFDQTAKDALNPAATANSKEWLAVFRRDVDTVGMPDHIYGWSWTILRDGFDTGDVSRWSSSVP
jgi:hypothetical protein